MPPSPKEKTLTVEDFGAFLERLSQEGFECVVIGGCAVGAYAALRGDKVFTADLDVYADPETLDRILSWAARNGIPILKRPQPRTIPVAFIQWEGKDVNILTDSIGLPAPEDAARIARLFTLSKCGGIEVLVADPVDILRNKMLVDREKDRPHVEVLRRFIEEEIVEAFEKEVSPRTRIRPARQYLDATRAKTLPGPLAARLIPLARTLPDIRFLLSAVPDEGQAREILEKGRAFPEASEELQDIFKARRFGAKPSARPRPVRPSAARPRPARQKPPGSGPTRRRQKHARQRHASSRPQRRR